MTTEELLAEKERLVKIYEELRDKMNQTLGALMWINQAVTKNDAPKS